MLRHDHGRSGLLRAGCREHAHPLPADDARHRPPHHQRPRLHRRQRRHGSGRDRATHRRVPAARVLLLRELGKALRPVEGQDDDLDPRVAGAAHAFAAGIRTARARARGPRHRLEPRSAGDVPQDAGRLLPHVAPPLRVPAARLRGVSDVLRVLQEGVPGDQRPDDLAHGRGHRSGDLPARRRAAPSGARGRGSRPAGSLQGRHERERHPRVAGKGRRARQEVARGARDLARSVVQHQRRRRLLSLPPLVAGRSVDAVLGPARIRAPREGGRIARAAGGEAAVRAQAARSRTIASCSPRTRSAPRTTR